jgi:protein TonB
MQARVSLGVLLGASILFHGVFVYGLAVPDNSLAAASPPPALTALGNSFDDLVQGTPPVTPETVEPVDPVEMTEHTPPSNRKQPAATTVTEQTPLDTTQPETAMRAEQVPQLRPTPSTEMAQTEETEAGLQLQFDELSETPADVLASATTPEIGLAQSATPTPLSMTQMAQATSAQPERLEALPDVQLSEVTDDTVRPKVRPTNLEAQPAPRQQRQTATQMPPRQTTSASQGNATQNGRRGTATATQNTGQAAQQGQGKQVDQAAVRAARQAAANYGNVVRRRISRTRRERTRGRGLAVVSFRIGPSGQLSAVGISRSSGDQTIDQLAINHMRRAAPFPPPPPGARTSFSIEYEQR